MERRCYEIPHGFHYMDVLQPYFEQGWSLTKVMRIGQDTSVIIVHP